MPDYRLRPEEKAALSLRGLYADYGYSFYRMSRFEEYDFYADKKDFLTSKNILTFTDADGKLMALRPDVTLSIIKHVKSTEGVQKFFYDEKVYRVPRNADTFHEIAQSGIECIGSLGDEHIAEVLELAVKSLHTIAQGRRCVLDVSHAGLIASLIQATSRQQKPSLVKDGGASIEVLPSLRGGFRRGLEPNPTPLPPSLVKDGGEVGMRWNTNAILKCLAEKNIHGLRSLNAPDELIQLAELEGSPESTLPAVREVTKSHALDVLSALGKYNEIHIDFSTVNNLNYYNGIVFRGFIEGITESILSGGQYDNLMALMGHKDAKAIGFAVNLDLIREEVKADA